MKRRIPPAPVLALVVGLILTCAYGWVIDDAFIYFRYADNAALLHAGLVFNQGEYVEGFTSPLWMLVWVVARAVHLRYWPVILTVGLGGMLASWLLAIRVNRRLSGEQVVEFHLPALWLASCYAVESHFTSGLETPLVQISALAFAALVLQPGVRWLQILVALGPLVRPELNLAFVVGVAWCWWSRRRVPWTLLGIGVLTQAAWLVFRLYYYADFFPNTFYLKDTQAPGRGLHYLHDTLRAYHLYFILGGLVLMLSLAAIKRGRREIRLGPRVVLWLTALAHTAYVVRIGGDFVHYRYLAFPVLVVVASLGGVVEQFLGRAGRWQTWAALGLGVAFSGLVILAYPTAQLPRHPLLIRPTANSLAMYRVDGVEDAAAHRGRVDLAPGGWDKGAGEVTRILDAGPLVYRSVMETGWCRDAYGHLDRFVIHSFGLTDAVLAHVRAPTPTSHAGHRWVVQPLARDLVSVRRTAMANVASAPMAPGETGESVYRIAIGRGRAAPWIIRNFEALETIDQRTHRPRALGPNVSQALRPWPTLRVFLSDVNAARFGAS